jgi:hypothetical protein
MNYQAVLRDDQGDVLVSSPVIIRFSLELFQNDQSPTYPYYIEEHSTSTNEFGLVNAVIGHGTVTYGDWDNIAWGEYSYVLRTEVDAGNGFIDMGISHFRSVPFSFRATKATNMEMLDLTDVEYPGNQPPAHGDVLRYNAEEGWFEPQPIPEMPIIPESQELTLSGDTLSISGGNAVLLPYVSRPPANTEYFNLIGAELFFAGWPMYNGIPGWVSVFKPSTGWGGAPNCDDPVCQVGPFYKTIHLPHGATIQEFKFIAEGGVSAILYRKMVYNPEIFDQMAMMTAGGAWPEVLHPVIDNEDYIYFLKVLPFQGTTSNGSYGYEFNIKGLHVEYTLP